MSNNDYSLAAARPAVLRPYIADEAIKPRDAASYAGVHPGTLGAWARRHHIGRCISGNMMISRVALQAFLEDETEILAAYLSGDRESPEIRGLYARLGIELPTAQFIAAE